MIDIIDWEEQLDLARKLDPAIVPHLEAIRRARNAIMQEPRPSHPKGETDIYQLIVDCRRGALMEYAIGNVIKQKP